MIVLLSPAKTIDCTAIEHATSASQPAFLKEADYLVKKLSKCSSKKLQALMNISPELAELNVERYRNWHTPFHPGNSSPCIECFQGEVYRGLDAKTLTKPDLEFAQRHLRILSGLYGVLRPLDLMQPYRLEMGTKLVITPTKRNLYTYWGNRIAEAIAADSEGPVVNLASQEYSKAVQRDALKTPVIDIEFKDLVGDQFKVLGTYAKHARGAMARFAIKHQITDPEGLKEFNAGGYLYTENLSTETTWVFTRDQKTTPSDV
jgi:cytoplasmic iron level regulating protein YaaA (DUF328/UPF0246 family)